MWLVFLIILPFAFLAGCAGKFVAAVFLSLAFYAVLFFRYRRAVRAYADSMSRHMEVIEKTADSGAVNALRERIHWARNGGSCAAVSIVIAAVSLLPFVSILGASAAFILVYFVIAQVGYR